MDTGSFLPAFLLLIPIVLAVVDLLGIGSSHSSMGHSLPRSEYAPPRPAIYRSA